MQDDRCREFAKEIQYPIESDAVEGFLKVSNDLPAQFKGDKATGVMISSSRNVVTSRWNPLLITLMGGKTNEHYYHHFKVLLGSLNVAGDDYDDFVENFPGHTTDFSIAQTNGFLQALKEYVLNRFSVEKTDYELRTDLNIRYCTVHFKRTLYRVARNTEFIPSSFSGVFVNEVLKLLHFKNGQVEQFMEQFLLILRTFTEVGPWLQWHIQPGIATVLFPACKNFKTDARFRNWDKNVPNNTNAAESMCRKFQDLSAASYMDLCDCIRRAWRRGSGC
jgi:hypothetical protein